MSFCDIMNVDLTERGEFMPYIYNTGTNKLHIEGYCHYSNAKFGVKKFNTENEALAFDGRAVSMCKICQRKKDNEMRIKK